MITTKEVYKILEPAHFLKDNDVFIPQSIKNLEIRRRLIDFYHEIDTARFMLAMSFKQANIDPYLDLFNEDDFDNEFKHNYYRQHYLYSAVIWYHNCFDMFLQCLWFNFELYKGGQITNKNFKDIIHDCNPKSTKESLNSNTIKKRINRFQKENKKVLEIANVLKHKQYIENSSYLLYCEAFTLKNEEYDSDLTKTKIELDELQSMLIVFHKDLIAMAKEILLPIHNSIT